MEHRDKDTVLYTASIETGNRFRTTLIIVHSTQ